ncbi:MAG: urease subunit gamma [Thaumarchaeota archaeon]|nr:urease subunit gamma [Nitrososphaerota archaeon]
MKIEVSIQGDPDIKPFTKIFYYEKSDELIFFESTQLTKNRLLNNMRLNINEVLGLFVAYVITSLNEHKTIKEIQKQIPKLLLPHQVMIGVPEGLRKLTFTITTNGNNSEQISITTPIRIDQYFLDEQKQTV